MFFEESKTFEFEKLTILCGNNGSGKSALLNIIATGVRIRRCVSQCFFKQSQFTILTR